jgi:polysaccharide biosynthesis transport protein
MQIKGVSDSFEDSGGGASSVPLFDLVGAFRRRWPLMAAGMVFGIVLAGAYCCIASTKYEADAQILIMKRESSLPARGVERSTEAATEISEDLMATHMQLLQSPLIIQAALSKHGLEGLESIRRRLKTDQDEVEYIIDRLKITRGGNGQARLANVLGVTFRHVSDVECQQILSAVVEGYQDFLDHKFQDVGMEAGKLIAQANDQLGKDLEQAEQAYQACREQTPLLWNGDLLSNTHRINYERLQTALADLRLQRASVKTRLDTVEQAMADRKDSPLSHFDLLGLIDDAHVDRLGLLAKRGAADTEEFQATVPARTANARAEYDGLLALAQKEQSLLADYGSEHPLVQDVRKQLAVTRSFLDQKSSSLTADTERSGPKTVLASYVTMLKNDLQTLDAREAELEQLSAAEEQAAKALVSSELRAETLRAQVTRKQELYQTVLDRLREINLVKDYSGVVTDVIAPVKLGEKAWPKPLLLLLAGAFVGLVLGSGAAIGAEQLDRSLRNSDEVRQLMPVPILMEMPEFRRVTTTAAVSRAVDATLGETLAAYHRPKSYEAEVFRSLRTSLFFNSRGGSLRTILCTSPNLGDGKTWVAANLAISIAQTGRRVLLIDADLRRPMVHRLFNLATDTGLSCLIAEQQEPPDAVQMTSVENLWAIPCGAIVDNPAELLSSADFARCLQVLREQYDYVIVDAPPLLAVSDPCIIAPLVDTVMLTVRIGYDTHRQAARSMELLEGVGANVLGVVINGADAGSKRRSGSALYGLGRYAAAGDQGAGGHYFADVSRGSAEVPDGNGHVVDRGRTNGAG